MEAGQLRMRFEMRDSACVVVLGGKLTVVTEPEFTARLTQALAALRGPVLFDVSGLDFADCHGARALAGAVRAVPPRPTGLYGCSPAVRRMLDMLGFDLPHLTALVREVQVRQQQPPAQTASLTRGETLAALARRTESNSQRSATYASEVMSRLAATYADLALSSRYRTPRKSDDRGRLLALSGRARELSRQFMSHAASDAG